MTAKLFRWFLTITIVVSILVTAIYHSYMSPHARYDIWKDEYHVMVPGGEWMEETIAEKET
jgi:hypothetical protein